MENNTRYLETLDKGIYCWKDMVIVDVTHLKNDSRPAKMIMRPIYKKVYRIN